MVFSGFVDIDGFKPFYIHPQKILRDEREIKRPGTHWRSEDIQIEEYTSFPDPRDAVELSLLIQAIENALETLTWREATVIRERYGLKDGVIKTLEEIGDLWHVSRERIRQIEAKALRKLRHPERAKKLRHFIPEIGDYESSPKFKKDQLEKELKRQKELRDYAAQDSEWRHKCYLELMERQRQKRTEEVEYRKKFLESPKQKEYNPWSDWNDARMCSPQLGVTCTTYLSDGNYREAILKTEGWYLLNPIGVTWLAEVVRWKIK